MSARNSVRETLQIALSKARSAEERRLIDGLMLEFDDLARAEIASIRQVRENKIRRGEKLRPLTRAELKHLEEEMADAGLHRVTRKHFESMTLPGEVLQSLVHDQLFAAELTRQGLEEMHPDDRAIDLLIVDRNRALATAMLSIINDPEIESKVRRDVAIENLRIASGGNGGEIVPVLEIDDETIGDQLSGKSIAASMTRLDDLAREIGVTPLSSFLGFAGIGSGDWFDPRDGLATVEALRARIRPATYTLRGKKALLGELGDLAVVLAGAISRGTRFHIEVDA
jgi:hypothetical protein